MLKYNFNLLLAIIILGFNPLFTRGQDMTNAGTYMNFFNEQYKPIQKDMWDYTSAIAKGKKAKKIASKRNDLLATLASAEKKASSARDWSGDESLKNQVISWLKSSQIILTEDYGAIMDLEEIAEQSYDNMEAYLLAKEKASEHMQESNTALSEVTKKFAAANGVNLLEEDTRLGLKLERANKAFEHYNDVFLVFFKSSKQEAYLINAISKGDVNAIEQNRSTLLEYAKEGRTKLRDIKAHNADGTLKLACDKALQFYIQESDEDIQTVIDFLMKKEHFEKAKASFEAKKKSKRTQSDVDEYNNAINEYNASINEYNMLNEAMNKRRTQANNFWNKSVDKFMSKHAT